MRDRTDPSRTLREAWNVVRLDAIRAFVGETIQQLKKLSREQLQGRAIAHAGSRFEVDPIGAAWQACSDELRAESGLADPLRSERTTVLRRRLAAEPEWALEYHEALGQYRRAAAQNLNLWLDALLPDPHRSASTMPTLRPVATP
jgi:hypothetical protein